MASDNKNWSMDGFFVMNLNALIQRFIEAVFVDDFEQMYKAVLMLEIISSPKIDHDEVEEKLKWLKENRHKANVVDAQGNVIGHNPTNKIKIQDILHDTFRLILIKLEEEDIYTQKIIPLEEAMGQMDT